MLKAKHKILAIIIASILVLSALAGGIAAIVLNEINKSTATTQSADSTIGNLYNTDGTINAANVSAFLTKIGYYSGAANTTQDSQQIASRLGSGTSYVFKMGYYANTSNQIDSTHRELEWEAVYLRDGYLTIWLTRPYTISLFNASGTTDSNLSTTYSPFAGYTTRPSTYGYYSNYSYSTLRDSTLNIWEAMSSSHDGLSSFIVPPSTSAISAWQSNQNDTYYSSSRYMHHNGLGTYSGSYSWGSGTGTTWRSCLTDMFWIPSAFEVLNDQTGSGNASTTEGGLWNIASNAYTETRYDTGASLTNYTNYCWLRSGHSSYSGSAMLGDSSGSASINRVNNSYGVRPAAHISLTALQNLVKYSVTTAVTPEGSGTASGGQSDIVPNSQITLTATPNAGYSFVGWSLDGGNTLIPESIGKSEYTITVTQDATYTAVFEGGITITSANPSTEFTILRESNDGVTHSYLIQTIDTNYLYRIAVIQSGTPNEEDYNKVSAIDGYISGQEYCTAVHYITNTTGNSFVLEVYNATAPFTIYLDFTDTAQNFKPAGSLDGVGVSVAYQNADGSIDTGSTNTDGTSLYAIGEARIQGYTTTENLTEVIVIAKAYTGYEFKGWMIDGEFISYTDENDNEITLIGTSHMSARIPFEIVNGKQIFAVFGAIDKGNINDDTNTDNDFV